jgi:hypothetical protein
MGLLNEARNASNIKDVKRIDYFDTRYYKILYEVTEKVGKKLSKKLMEQFFPSVTEILGAYPKDFLARWRGDVGNERADQIVADSQRLGSFIHNAAEVLAKKGALIYNPYGKEIYSDKQISELKKKYKDNVAIVRFQQEFVQLYRIWQWFNEVKPTEIETEQTVYSIKHKYAGTLDLLMYIDEGEYKIAGSKPIYLQSGFYVGDYKTGKYSSETHLMQSAAYIQAIKESLPDLNIIGSLIIQPNNEKITTGIEGLKTTFSPMSEQRKMFEHFLSVYAVYKIKKPIPDPKAFTMPSILTIEQPKKKTSRGKK